MSDVSKEEKELVFTYNDLIEKGIQVKDIRELEKHGAIIIGHGRLESGQIIKLIKVTPKGRVLMGKYPTAKYNPVKFVRDDTTPPV